MKIKTISQLLDVVEAINKIHDAENIKIEIRVDGIESDEDIKQLARQEHFQYHEPCVEIPKVWAIVQLGNVECSIFGVSKEVNITFN